MFFCLFFTSFQENILPRLKKRKKKTCFNHYRNNNFIDSIDCSDGRFLCFMMKYTSKCWQKLIISDEAYITWHTSPAAYIALETK